MKLLGVRNARSIWLAPQQFFNPKGIFLRKASLDIKTRYQFLKSPYDNSTAGTQEAKYELGGYKTKRGETIQIDTVILHMDGVIVDCRSSTEDADEFLEDAFAWLSAEHGLPPIGTFPLKRLYASELNVELDKQPAFLTPKLTEFLRVASEALGDPKKGELGFLGFSLTTDPEQSPRPAQFRFEREIHTPLDSKRFYTFAPIQTRVHIRLIQQLEDLV
jgi:hypothetical protein